MERRLFGSCFFKRKRSDLKMLPIDLSLFLFAKSAFFPYDHAEWLGTHDRGQNCNVEREFPHVPPPCHHPAPARSPPSSHQAPITPPPAGRACLSEPSCCLHRPGLQDRAAHT